MNLRFKILFLSLVCTSYVFQIKAQTVTKVSEILHIEDTHKTSPTKGILPSEINERLLYLCKHETYLTLYDKQAGRYLDDIKTLALITRNAFYLNYYNTLKGIYYSHKYPTTAYEYLVRALKYYKDTKDTTGILLTTYLVLKLDYSLTVEQFRINEVPEKLYHEAINIAVSKNNKSNLETLIYHLLVITFSENFNPLHFDKQNCQILTQLYLKKTSEHQPASDFWHYLILHESGIFYSKVLDYKTAFVYFEKAYNIMQKYDSQYIVMLAYRIAAYNHYNNRDPNFTYKYAELSLFEYYRLPLEHQNPEALTAIHDMLFKATHLLGRYEETYEYQHAFRRDHSAILGLRHKQLEDALKEKFNNEKLKLQIAQSDVYAKQLIYLLYLLIVMIGTLMIFISWRQVVKKRIENQIQLRDMIYSIIGHDLNSPLHKAQNLLRLYATKYPLGDGEINDINNIQESMNQINVLLNNMLTWYKSIYLPEKQQYVTYEELIITINKIAQLYESNHLNFVVINTLSEHMTKKRIPVHLHILETMLRNIIDNSVKHAQSQYIHVVISLPQKNKMNIAIEDNGKGLPNHIKKFLNDSLYEKVKVPKMQRGFGMYILTQLSKKYGYPLSFVSNKKGTTFNIIIKKPNQLFRLQNLIIDKRYFAIRPK